MKAAVTTLAFCVAALLALGMVMLYSSSSSMMQHGVRVGANYLMTQMLWCGLGLVVCVVATMVDYRLLKPVVWPLFAVAIVLLVLVLLPLPHGLTRKINGANRWFILPGFRLQPSELGKLALILALAWYGDRRQWYMNTWWRGLVVPALIALPILGLIFIEPDRGSTILLAGVSGIMLLLAGVNLKQVVLPVLVGVGAMGVTLAYDPMRLARLRSWWDLEGTKTGVGFQGYQSILALGSGGWTGQGLGNGRQKLGYVPQHHTDFIFSIIGEELGLVATLLVVVAFLVILLCGLYIALRSPDRFGLLLGCGVTFLIALQAFINIGVVTGALPNKGLPLPFISYGGSNLLAMLACIGLLFSIARRARESDTVREPLISGEIPQPA